MKIIVGLTAGAALAVGAAAPASAAIREYPDEPSAMPLARAMARQPSQVRRAVFVALPNGAKPAAVSTTRMSGFPLRGSSFALLSTGNAKLADDPNTETNSGSESGGPSVRGARDVVIMRIDIRVPPKHNCLSFGFRFLSEEFPEFVGDQFNDAFIAEVGGSNWDASSKDDPTITSPLNFASDTHGSPIRINRTGVTGMTAFRARGTTYDGATRTLRASTAVQPGVRHLYLSLFDQGDRIYDSAAFLDDLHTSRASTCATGVRLDN